MSKKIALLGDLSILQFSIGQNLLKEEIAKELCKGNTHFLLTYLNDFDNIAFDSCLSLRRYFPELQMTIVINDLKVYENKVKDISLFKNIDYTYLPLKENLLVRKNIQTNKYLIDKADKILCCFNDFYLSQYKEIKSYLYHTKKEMINIFEKANML